MLQPGQFVFGRKRAAIELNMKESTVRDYINILKEDGTITIKSTNKFSIVSVVNWGFYQNTEGKYDSKTNTKSNNKTPTKQQQNDINNNGDNVNNDNNGNNDINYIHALFEYYISKNIIQHKKLTETMKREIRNRLKEYSFEDLKKAIDNYATVLNSEMYYFTHKYTLADFMTDKNVEKFLDEANPLENFKDRTYKQSNVIPMSGYDPERDAF